MPRSTIAFLSILFASLTHVAHADDVAERHLELGLASFANAIGDAKATLAGVPSITPEQCVQVIADARAAGIPAGHVIQRASMAHVTAARKVGTEYAITLDHAAALCDEFAAWYRLAQAKAVLDEGQRLLGWLRDIDPATNHADNARQLAAAATKCTAELERIVAAGVPPGARVPITGRDGTLTIAEGQTSICDALAAAARTFAAEVTSAKAARTAKLAAPYTAIGIDGDRLRLLVDHAGYAFYGVGGHELTSAKQLAGAALLFEQSRADDGTYAVTRYHFWGDKLVGTTRATFVREPGRNAFK